MFPITKLTDLPTFTATPGTNLTVLGVVDNIMTVRMEWSNLTSDFITYTATPPLTPDTPGADGAVALDSEASYTYVSGKWGKTPRYTANWGDITSTTRFLRVDEAMALNSTELDNLNTTLNLKPANNAELGLVKGSDSVVIDTNGQATVPSASTLVAGIVKTTGPGVVATTDYVNTIVGGIPTPVIPAATDTVPGIVMSSDTVTANSYGKLSVHISSPGNSQPGLVRVAPTLLENCTPEHGDYVATVDLSKGIASNTVSQMVTPATASKTGIVRPGNTLVITDATTGTIDVVEASPFSAGIVTVMSSIPVEEMDTHVVPNMTAVKEYVANQSNTAIDPTKLPFATASTRGTITSSATVRVNETGANRGQAYVPTATSSTAGVVLVIPGVSDPAPYQVPSKHLMQTSITNATANIKTEAVNEIKALRANATTFGLVKTELGATDNVSSSATVPTVKRMQEYVTARITTSWSGGVVPNPSTFQGGLTTPNVTDPQPTSVLNYGQLSTLISGGGDPSTPNMTVSIFDPLTPEVTVGKKTTSEIAFNQDHFIIGTTTAGHVTVNGGIGIAQNTWDMRVKGLRFSDEFKISDANGEGLISLSGTETPPANDWNGGTVTEQTAFTADVGVSAVLNVTGQLKATYNPSWAPDHVLNITQTAEYVTDEVMTQTEQTGISAYVKDHNVTTGTYLSFWSGTQAQYDQLGTKDSQTIYIIV